MGFKDLSRTDIQSKLKQHSEFTLQQLFFGPVYFRHFLLPFFLKYLVKCSLFCNPLQIPRVWHYDLAGVGPKRLGFEVTTPPRRTCKNDWSDNEKCCRGNEETLTY